MVVPLLIMKQLTMTTLKWFYFFVTKVGEKHMKRLSTFDGIETRGFLVGLFATAVVFVCLPQFVMAQEDGADVVEEVVVTGSIIHRDRDFETPSPIQTLAVTVSDGMLLMFPSYLAHSVAPNESDKLRISISFNMMFSRYAKHLSGPLWESTIDTPVGE